MKTSLLPVLGLSLMATAATPGLAQTDTAPTNPPATVPPATAPETAPATPNATPAAPSTNAAAHKVVADSIAAYTALTSLSSKVALTDSQGEKKVTMNGTFWYAKPNKAKLELSGQGTLLRSVLDGKTYTRQMDPKTYVSAPITGSKSVDRVWAGAPSFGGNFLTSFLAGQNVLDQPPFKTAEFTLTSEGDVDHVSGPLPLGPNVLAQLQLDFDHNNRLLQSIRVDLELRGKKFYNLTTFSDVKVNPTVIPGTFVYKPGPGVRKLSQEEQESYWDLRLKKGAQPFPISAKDLKGKSQTLTQYKGKVLLVDFWATWCGPCVGELPNVQATYKKYHGKGFEILGISLDEEKSELTSFIKAKGMPWAQIYSGKGWQDPIVGRYGVKGIPFTMLVGKDGKIVDVNLRGPALEAAVKKAVAAK